MRVSPVVTNRIVFVLSLAGCGVSTYLTLAHLNVVELRCGASHGCEDVAAHWSAHGFGIPGLQAIPTAAFGILMYLALAGLSMSRVASGSQEAAMKASRMQAVIATVALLTTGFLTYLEAFVIHAWCQWCLASAAIILMIFLTACVEQSAARPADEGAIA